MTMIKKAVIAVGGFGTRLLPATKAQPKEMMVLVDKPVIHYIVEEASQSGIKDIIFVTSPNKQSIKNYFGHNLKLEQHLRDKNKTELLKQVIEPSKMANFFYVYQKKMAGCGGALLRAESLIKNEPFAVMFGDDVIDNSVPCLRQMTEIYKKYKTAIVAVQKVPRSEVSKYGVIKGRKIKDRVYKIESLVEKPSIKEAPSDLAIVGRYIFPPTIFKYLKKVKINNNGELGVTEAILEMIQDTPVYAYEFKGTRLDCGSKLGYLKANFYFGKKHKEIGKEFNRWLKQNK